MHVKDGYIVSRTGSGALFAINERIFSPSFSAASVAPPRKIRMPSFPERPEATGMIRAYGARVDIARLGPSISVFVMVELDAHKASSFRTFERAVAAVPAITGCRALGGGYDYLLRVVARDVDAYQRLIDRLLDEPARMRRYYSYVVAKEICDRPPPFERLFGENRS